MRLEMKMELYFNPLPRGSDEGVYRRRLGVYRFQSAPRGERRETLCEILRGWALIHAPRGGATQLVFIELAFLRFQSTLPRGATCDGILKCRVDIFQSTLPAGERPGVHRRTRTTIQISIHAPAGERRTRQVGAMKIKISIRSRGRCTCPVTSPRKNISIHASRGSDQIKGELHELLAISIHAPRGGATAGINAAERRVKYFNPRSPRGATGISPDLMAGGRIQPRSPRGGDRHPECPLKPVEISIHAPRGSDTSVDIAVLDTGHFNPRSPRGSDGQSVCCQPCCSLFQSTLPRGSDSKLTKI